MIMIYGYTRAKLPAAKEMVPAWAIPKAIAQSLFTNYLLPFEVTSILLLVAIVGAWYWLNPGSSEAVGESKRMSCPSIITWP